MARLGLAAGAGAVSKVRFAPCSNNLIVSSWDSGLRLYDANASALRLEANSEAALLDCCFKDEFVAFAGDSVGSIVRYDLHSGAQDTVGLHDDAVVSTEFSQTTGQLITSSLDKKLYFWDTNTRSVNPNNTLMLDSVVASLSVCDMYILVAVERDVYRYDMRNLKGPIKAKDSPLKHHIRCLHASEQWKGYAAGSMDGTVALKYFDHEVDNDMGYTFRCHPRSGDGTSSLVPINTRKLLLLEIMKDMPLSGTLYQKRSCLSFLAIRAVWCLWRITIVVNFWQLLQTILIKEQIEWWRWRDTRYISKQCGTLEESLPRRVQPTSCTTN